MTPFPPPWTIEETDSCFIVKDHAGLSLAYVYFEEEPGRHYEMTRYGTLIAGQRNSASRECVPLLQQNLDEKRATDKKLTAMAEAGSTAGLPKPGQGFSHGPRDGT